MHIIYIKISNSKGILIYVPIYDFQPISVTPKIKPIELFTF